MASTWRVLRRVEQNWASVNQMLLTPQTLFSVSIS